MCCTARHCFRYINYYLLRMNRAIQIGVSPVSSGMVHELRWKSFYSSFVFTQKLANEVQSVEQPKFGWIMLLNFECNRNHIWFDVKINRRTMISGLFVTTCAHLWRFPGNNLKMAFVFELYYDATCSWMWVKWYLDVYGS